MARKTKNVTPTQYAEAATSTIEALTHLRIAIATAEADVGTNPVGSLGQLLSSLQSVRRLLAGDRIDDPIDQLRAAYQRKVRELVRRFEPELAAAAGKTADEQLAAACRLEAACKSALCSTKENARLAWALSAHWEYENDLTEWNDVREGAAAVVAYDVAALSGVAWCRDYYSIAGARRWDRWPEAAA